jgi:hypothetical protein
MEVQQQVHRGVLWQVPVDLPRSLRMGERVPHAAQRALDVGALLGVRAVLHSLWGLRAILQLGVSILLVPLKASHERHQPSRGTG